MADKEKFTWDELCDRAENCAHLEPELKAKDWARGEIRDLMLRLRQPDPEEAESPEEAIEEFCRECGVIFSYNGCIECFTRMLGETEDKGKIAEELGKVIRMTRAGSDLLFLIYIIDAYTLDETVTAYFASGGTKRVNVTADSGWALIRDVAAQLDIG